MSAGVVQGSHEPRTPLVEAARGALESHTHFRGRLDRFIIDEDDGQIVIKGVLPSFYLKQLLQSLLIEVEGVDRVINRVEVVSSYGVSGCSERTREQCALEYSVRGKQPECFPTCQGTPGDPQERKPHSVSLLMP